MASYIPKSTFSTTNTSKNRGLYHKAGFCIYLLPLACMYIVSFHLSPDVVCRCYTVGGEGGQGGHKSQAQLVEEDRQAALKELEPLKLPGKLAEYTGNVMYPNEESAVWDVDGE